MNFIDAALAKQSNLSDDDFLQAMAGIYKEPDVWDILDAYPPYIQDVIYIIDYDTVSQMEGLAGVLESGRPEKYAKSTMLCCVPALWMRHIFCVKRSSLTGKVITTAGK